MKFLSKTILIIFILFLATPTIVSVIDKDLDISFFFNLNEEEESDFCFDEMESIPSFFSFSLALDFEGFQKNKFSIFGNRKLKSIKPIVILQPPDLV